MLEKVEMGEKSNSHNTIIEEKKNAIYKLLVENVFSKRSRSKQKKPKTEYSQPDSSRNKLEIIQSKSIASFFICSTETFETCEYV